MVSTLKTASSSPPYVSTTPISAKISNWIIATDQMASEIQVIKAKNFELS